MTRHHIGTIADFPEGKGRRVDIDGIRIAVFNIDGNLYGIQDLCTHKRLPLHPVGREVVVEEKYRENKQHDQFTLGEIDTSRPAVSCPWHGLSWDLVTGKNDVNNDQISTFEVEVEDDEVFMTI